MSSFESPSPYHAFQDAPEPDPFQREKAEAKGLFTCGGQCRRWCRRLSRRLLCCKEESESRYIRLNVARPTPHRFPSNRVVNTKYNALNFLPKVCQSCRALGTRLSGPQRGSPRPDSHRFSRWPLRTACSALAGAVRAVLVLFQPVLSAGGGIAVLPAANARCCRPRMRAAAVCTQAAAVCMQAAVVCMQAAAPSIAGLRFSYVAPLVFVLGVTMSKEAYDDWRRSRQASLVRLV